MLAAVPAVWMLHFGAVYALVSFACIGGAEGFVRPGIAIATLAALSYYAVDGLHGRRDWQSGDATARFIGGTRQLLAGLAAVGTVWVALPAFLVAPCAG